MRSISLYLPDLRLINSLTVRDRNFLLSVSKREKPDDGYELDSPERVLDWLEESSFSRQEVENRSLFEYLLEKKKERYLVVWLHSLNSKYDRTRTEYSFAVRLWKETKFSDYLVKLINSTVPNWFREWTELGGLLDDAEWQRYAVETILYSTPEALEKVNDKNWLTNEISERKSFLQIDDPQIDKLVSGFKTLKVSFRNIVYRKEDMPLVRRVYLPNPDFEAVCTTNQKPKFSGTEEHRVILEFFKQQGWISSYQKLPSGKYQAFSTMKKTAGV